MLNVFVLWLIPSSILVFIKINIFQCTYPDDSQIQKTLPQISLVSFFINLHFNLQYSLKFQGPYDIDLHSYEVIKGPKQKSIGTFNFSVTKENSDYFSHCNLTIFEQGRLEEVCSNKFRSWYDGINGHVHFFKFILKVKVTVLSVEGTRKSVLWNYRLTKPCTHFLLGPLFDRYMHVNNCIIKKVSIDYREICHTFEKITNAGNDTVYWIKNA